MVKNKKSTSIDKAKLKKRNNRQVKETSVEYVAGAKNRSQILKLPEKGSFLNRIICGDTVEVMKSMPADSVDLVVTSPSYNLKNSTGNGMKDERGEKWKNAALVKGYSPHDDNMPHNEYVAWQKMPGRNGASKMDCSKTG